MAWNGFTNLDDSARVWLFVLQAPLEGAVAEQFLGALTESLARWRHKDMTYQAQFELVQGQVLVVAEPTMATQPSGCAIEGLNRKIQRTLSDVGAALLPEDAVVIQSRLGMEAVPREGLGDAAASGRLEAVTPILDRTLFNLGDLRRKGLFQPAGSTWVGRKVTFSNPAV